MVKWNVGVAMSELACKVYFDKLEMESVGDVLGLWVRSDLTRIPHNFILHTSTYYDQPGWKTV